MPGWVVLVIIAREFIISGFRLVAAEKGVVIAASFWAKIKTTVQMIMALVLIFNFQVSPEWAAETFSSRISISASDLWSGRQVLSTPDNFSRLSLGRAVPLILARSSRLG